MKKQYFYFLLALGLASSARSQTLVDLRTQSKSVDFSALPSTRPVQVGTTLPGTCQVGRLFFKSDAVAGSNLYGCTAANTWSVQANGSSGSGGGSGSGATMASQLGDLQPVRTSSNVLTIGSGCSATTPCNVRFGSTSYSITSPATATLSGSSTGMLYIYAASTGALTIGHNLAVTCSGCVSQSGVTSFPSDSIPLATWTVSNGTLDTAGKQDFRAMLSAKNIVAGQGLVASDTNGNAVISVDTTLVGLRVAVPAASTSSCQVGSWSNDSNFLYVCVSTNAWKRSALSSW
jgi:hypothetical protein